MAKTRALRHPKSRLEVSPATARGERSKSSVPPSAPRSRRTVSTEESLEFVFKLQGKLRDMNVFELAPTLQSMGVALREANRTLFPQSTDLRVAVKPIQEGSYEIHYVLSYAQEMLPIVAMAVSSAPDGVNQIAKLLGDLGVIKNAGAGVLNVIQKLRGKPRKIEEVKPNQYWAESEHGAVVIDGNVKKLIQNSTVIEQMNITLVQAAKPEVTDIKTYLAEDPDSSMTVTKEVAAAVEKFVKQLNKPGDEVKENISTVWVHPHRGPFSGDPGQWWFKRGRGEPFKASIKDKGFLDSYGRGDPRLNSGDLLEVQLLEKQTVSDSKLSTSYTILKVTKYKPGDKKQRLPFPKARRRRRR
jgi:hypothetical protein